MTGDASSPTATARAVPSEQPRQRYQLSPLSSFSRNRLRNAKASHNCDGDDNFRHASNTKARPRKSRIMNRVERERLTASPSVTDSSNLNNLNNLVLRHKSPPSTRRSTGEHGDYYDNNRNNNYNNDDGLSVRSSPEKNTHHKDTSLSDIRIPISPSQRQPPRQRLGSNVSSIKDETEDSDCKNNNNLLGIRSPPVLVRSNKTPNYRSRRNSRNFGGRYPQQQHNNDYRGGPNFNHDHVGNGRCRSPPNAAVGRLRSSGFKLSPRTSKSTPVFDQVDEQPQQQQPPQQLPSPPAAKDERGSNGRDKGVVSPLAQAIITDEEREANMRAVVRAAVLESQRGMMDEFARILAEERRWMADAVEENARYAQRALDDLHARLDEIQREGGCNNCKCVAPPEERSGHYFDEHEVRDVVKKEVRRCRREWKRSSQEQLLINNSSTADHTSQERSGQSSIPPPHPPSTHHSAESCQDDNSALDQYANDHEGHEDHHDHEGHEDHHDHESAMEPCDQDWHIRSPQQMVNCNENVNEDEMNGHVSHYSYENGHEGGATEQEWGKATSRSKASESEEGLSARGTNSSSHSRRTEDVYHDRRSTYDDDHENGGYPEINDPNADSAELEERVAARLHESIMPEMLSIINDTFADIWDIEQTSPDRPRRPINEVIAGPNGNPNTMDARVAARVHESVMPEMLSAINDTFVDIWDVEGGEGGRPSSPSSRALRRRQREEEPPEHEEHQLQPPEHEEHQLQPQSQQQPQPQQQPQSQPQSHPQPQREEPPRGRSRFRNRRVDRDERREEEVEQTLNASHSSP